MQELPWVFVGVLAVGASYARMQVFTGSVELWQKIATGSFAVVMWSIWAFSSLNVQTGELTQSYLSLALIGVVGTCVMALDVVKLTFEEAEVDVGL